MVRVEVVGNVGIDTGPRLEGLQLELWLRHVRAVKVEVAELLGTGTGVVVSWVESLVAGVSTGTADSDSSSRPL